MEPKLPSPRDHCRIQILLKPIEGVSKASFDRLVEKLTKPEYIKVSTSLARTVQAKFVTEVNHDLFRLNELQAFRKIFGLVCVAGSGGADFCDPNTPTSSTNINSLSSNAADEIDRSSASRRSYTIGGDDDEEDVSRKSEEIQGNGGITFNATKKSVSKSNSTNDERTSCKSTETSLSTIKEIYQDLKAQLSSCLVDSRCLIFGAQNLSSFCSNESPELIPLAYSLQMDTQIEMASEELERVAHELVRSIYFVLESKRLDTSFERKENQNCPTLPDEEKYQFGVVDPRAKLYRKKCLGRLRKRIGDYALLTGLPEAALNSYQSAIDILKPINDFLWLAAAYEGWCSAAMVLKEGNKLSPAIEMNGNAPGIPKISMTVSEQLTHTSSEHELKSAIGHQRYRSDEVGGSSGISGNYYNLAVLSQSSSKTDLEEEEGAQTSTTTETDDPEDAGIRGTENGKVRKKSPRHNSPDSAEGRKKIQENGQTQKHPLQSSDDEARKFPRIFGGGSSMSVQQKKKRSWRQLIDTFSSAATSSGAGSSKKDAARLKSNVSLPIVGHTSPANRSASMQNLEAMNNSSSVHHNQTINGGEFLSTGNSQNNKEKSNTATTALTAASRQEIFERFKLALEHYRKFSYVVFIEYECTMRFMTVFVFYRQYVEAEQFIREYNCKYLEDKFTVFNHHMKAEVCMANSVIFKEIGFRRKCAFFQRLAVLFRLHTENNDPQKIERDYKEIYPLIHQSLQGYGIGTGSDGGGSEKSRKMLSRSPIDQTIAPPHLPFALQIKAIHEAYICSFRAGYNDVAIRQLCYLMQNYFDYLEKGVLIQMIEELNKNVRCLGDRIHDLSQPIALEEHNAKAYPVHLLPLELTRIPLLSLFEICPLPAHLATTIVRQPSASLKIFIYSPFQEKAKSKKEIYWIVNCQSEVSLRLYNPLPVELTVKNLTLLTEGCNFEPLPVKITLPSCYASPASNPLEPKEFKLVGFPRTTGRLTFLGYSCEIFGVRNVCTLSSSSITKNKHKKGAHHSKKDYTVTVLAEQPLLEVETSSTMPRTPVLNGTREDAIAEAMVFSGQTINQKITLHNTSNAIAIRRVVIDIKQPEVCGGPKLLKLVRCGNSVESDEFPPSMDFANELEVLDIQPDEKREIELCIFGIDPTTSSVSTDQNLTLKDSVDPGKSLQIGEEQKFYLKRSNSAGQLTVVSVDSLPPAAHRSSPKTSSSTSATNTPEKPVTKSLKKQFLSVPGIGGGHKRGSSLSNSLSAAAVSDSDSRTGLLEEANNGGGDASTPGHDLIPYTGRLLTSEITFLYISDVSSEEGEEYCRSTRLPLAITIIPAMIISDWHVLYGDGPSTRYVVVDVTNQSSADTELTYGHQLEKRTLCVQPKETCRVPLLVPCCTKIKSSDFQMATKRASHMLQMREIEQLRRRVENHLIGHLDIRWSIPKLDINGIIPWGSLISSVSFLKQLVIPTLSLVARVNGSPCGSEDFVVGLGEGLRLNIDFMCSFRDMKNAALTGEIELECFQEVCPGSPPLDCSDALIVCGAYRRSFRVSAANQQEFTDRGSEMVPNSRSQKIADSSSHTSQPSFSASACQTEFCFGLAFLSEGAFKLRPRLSNLAISESECCSIGPDDMFIPTLAFNVITRI